MILYYHVSVYEGKTLKVWFGYFSFPMQVDAGLAGETNVQNLIWICIQIIKDQVSISFNWRVELCSATLCRKCSDLEFIVNYIYLIRDHWSESEALVWP